MAKEKPPDPTAEAREREAVARYQEKLQDRVTAIETEFDSALLLVAGGAISVSAAIVSSFDTKLSEPVWLLAAWWSWGLCLLFLLSGHQVSAYAHKRTLRLIDAGEYDLKVLLAGWAAKAIPWINGITFALLVFGFIAFGKFLYSNLDFRSGNEAQENSQTQNVQDRLAEITAFPQKSACINRSEQYSETNVGVAEAKEEVDNGRETETADTAATTEGRPHQETPTRAGAATGRGGEGDERPVPSPQFSATEEVTLTHVTEPPYVRPTHTRNQRMKKNKRSVVNAGAGLGAALSPREILALAKAARQLIENTEDVTERRALKLAMAKLRAAVQWKALHTKSRPLRA